MTYWWLVSAFHDGTDETEEKLEARSKKAALEYARREWARLAEGDRKHAKVYEIIYAPESDEGGIDYSNVEKYFSLLPEC